MTTDQTDVFGRDEGDNWFRRNQDTLGEARHDHVVAMAVKSGQQGAVHSVCELGCANGWRLAALSRNLPSFERLAGSDLSAAAIDDGKSPWPKLDLRIGRLDHPGFDEQFDLVVVSFVLHWVARSRLAEPIAAIDGLVGNRRAVLLADFLPDAPCAPPYHHPSDVEIFPYNQDYTQCLTGLGTYSEVERQGFSHSGAQTGAIDPQDRAVCALLRKST